MFSLSPRPKRTWQRRSLGYVGSRDPEGAEQLALYPDHVVIECTHARRRGAGRDVAGLADGLPGLAREPPARRGLVAVSAPAPPAAGRPVTRARDAVYVVFALNGFLFASLASRFPDVRSGLGLDNGSLGLLLLAIAAGSVIALPSAGLLIERLGATTVVRLGALAAAVGMAVAALGATALEVLPLAAVGLFAYGTGIGVWDVAMNVEGAEVERRLGRTIMPRFHAAFSIGTIAGAGLGVRSPRPACRWWCTSASPPPCRSR